jgi:hypothetical protein
LIRPTVVLVGIEIPDDAARAAVRLAADRIAEDTGAAVVVTFSGAGDVGAGRGDGLMNTPTRRQRSAP